MWEMKFIHPWAPHVPSFMRANSALPVIVGGFLGVCVWVWGLERGEVTLEEGDVVTLDKFLNITYVLWLNRMTFNLYVIHNPEVQSLQALWPSS